MLLLAPKLNEANFNVELMKQLAQLQANDDQGPICCNTTICLGKISCFQAAKDPFAPSQMSSVLGFAATHNLYSMNDCALGSVVSLWIPKNLCRSRPSRPFEVSFPNWSLCQRTPPNWPKWRRMSMPPPAPEWEEPQPAGQDGPCRVSLLTSKLICEHPRASPGEPKVSQRPKPKGLPAPAPTPASPTPITSGDWEAQEEGEDTAGDSSAAE
ncbi:N-terminal kinase-like protein [Myotis davidii]|uniref:N-terminal kinase-like protein n=1 Tax=Myotis davidii TaxID=225400 RepID=L5M7W1_MYODS|nr:N-terminal kinase-like protein [Myotis davidii]